MSDSIKSISDLKPDLKNARKRTRRSRTMLAESLKEVGAARSIVIDEQGRILAGNGTIEAAAAAGIQKVKVVEADGATIVAVQRIGLTEEEKQRLALFDNRTAELAEWNPDVLTELAEEGLDLSQFWDDKELDSLLGSVASAEEDDGEEEEGSSRPPVQERFPLAIVLTWAEHQRWQEIKESTGCKGDRDAFLRVTGIGADE